MTKTKFFVPFGFLKRSILLLFLLSSPYAYSSIYDYLPKDVGPTSGRYGGIGLIEVPTARFPKEGNLRLGVTSSWPYEVTALAATPFPWMEAVYRYTEVKNRLYSDIPSFSGNQTLKDKSFDFKFKLLKESKYLPDIALGLRDLAGTGLFAGEYLVASKRFWNLDATLGMGWGSLSGKGHYSNPLIRVSDQFSSRGYEQGVGGDFAYDAWFSGRQVSLFGGFEYSLPFRGWRLKAEYDTSNLVDEPWVTKPYNVSLASGVNDMIEYSIGYKGGRNFHFSFFIKGDFGTGSIVPKIDPPIRLTPPSEKNKNRLLRDRELLFGSINANLAVAKIYTQAISMGEDELTLTVNQAKFRSQPRAIGRSIRVAALLAPSQIKYITVNTMNADIELSSVTVRKDDFHNAANAEGSSAEIYRNAVIQSPMNQHYKSADFQPTVKFPEIRTNIAPAVRNMIGGPEAFYLGQLWIRINNTIKFMRGLELNTVIGLNLWQNFDLLKTPSDSTLPHVRSDIQEYLKEGKNNIMRMKLDYIFSPYRDIYARLDAGLLEEMFGGVGGEILYRPFNKTWAVGLALHRVKQRDYKQKFGFLKGKSINTQNSEYETETGHVEIYKEFPKQGVIAQVMAGKFLAGDRGATLDVSRRFKTGLRLGFFFTRTDATAEEFGEGGFDKGIYFQIPHDLFFTRFTTGQVFFGIHPLTRDGGALLVQHHSLYAITGNTAKYEIERDWEDILD